MDRVRLFGFLTIVVLLFLGNVSFSQNIIVGEVTYHSDDLKPLDNIVVGVYDLNNNLVMSTVTDADGFYTLYDVPSSEFNLRLTTSYDVDLPDLMDAYLTFQDLINNITLVDAEFGAADINNDGLITGYDYSHILVSLINGNFSPESDWQFKDA